MAKVPPNQCEYERSDVLGWGSAMAEVGHGMNFVLLAAEARLRPCGDVAGQTSPDESGRDKATGDQPPGMRNVVLI
jgi:hypothetical protein